MDSTTYSEFANCECDSAPTRPWTITIRPVSNGYIVDDGDTTEVIQVDESDKHGEVRAAASLLWRVLEMIGHYGTKHDPARVRVHIEGPDGEPVEPD